MNDELRPSPLAGSRSLGSNQVGMREYNERVVLQTIRQHGSVPKAELARLTRLSTQTVSVIINRLLDEGLVEKRDSVRGRIGQPSQPIALAADGAFSIGIRIGRRQLDLMLMDFAGQARRTVSTLYDVPDVDAIFDTVAVQLRDMIASLDPVQVQRLCGIGIAAPLMPGGWQQLVGLSPKAANQWTRTNVRERVQAMTTLPVEFAKDTAAACVAELVAGRGRTMTSYLHIFVDTLVGGGLVIDGQPHPGLYGNAGAVGSLPLAVARAGSAPPAQLLDVASLVALERAYRDAGLDEAAAGDDRALTAPWLPHTLDWLERCAGALALAAINAASLLDLDGVIVDGAIAPALLDHLLIQLRRTLDLYDWQGVMRPEVHAGMVGANAKVCGAAHLPLHAHFAPAHDLFLKAGRP